MFAAIPWVGVPRPGGAERSTGLPVDVLENHAATSLRFTFAQLRPPIPLRSFQPDQCFAPTCAEGARLRPPPKEIPSRS
nr:unnamed protein product [Digitaria exilis]